MPSEPAPATPNPRASARPFHPLSFVSLLLLGAALPVLWLINARIPPPNNLGASNSRLAACPDSPNCVSSQSTQPASRVEPLPFSGSPEAALARLRSLLHPLPRVHLAREEGDYLHYEFRTRICRFVDDVEFLLDRSSGVIHVRSASRLGYSDLGANRQRVESIRSLWSPDGKPPGSGTPSTSGNP